MVGRNISHYRITAKVGEGGMGVVYQAEDSKLERTVALKFLAAHLLADQEARKRFHREAKAAAALSHPNICRVHEIDEVEGRTFIAMEFLEGESLDKRIEQGPLKIAEALDIAQQIAKGLEAAHEKKIVHRDIKPGNVMVDEKGHVTVMDFGLALLTEGSKLTQLDTTLGTAAYMSPEQIQGMEVDRRTDIWALGSVLYEMVCGQRPFKGLYDQALLYEIVQEEPEPLTGVRTGVPLELEWLVGKCLAKAEAERYQNAGDVIVDLASLRKKLESGSSTIAQPQHAPLSSAAGARSAAPAQQSAAAAASSDPSEELVPKRKLRIFQALFAAAAVVALVLGVLASRQTPHEQPLRKFSFTPDSLSEWFVNRAVISPNGRHIVYVEGGQQTKLWVRDLDGEEPRSLDGTEGAHAPFWSPDSQFIGFGTAHWAAVGGGLKKVSVRGGAASTVCQLTGNYGGGAWSHDGQSIVFSSGPVRRLYEVPSKGGNPRLLVEPGESAESNQFAAPHFLPPEAGNRVLLFTLGVASHSEIVIQDLETGARKVLARGAKPVYSPSGHILYQTGYQQDGLWALPFSIATLEATGNAFPVGEEATEPSVASDGTLAYIGAEGQQQLVWRDREGERIGAIGQPRRDLQYPSLSPDGRHLAVRGYVRGVPESDIWVFDLVRAVRARLTFNPDHDSRPIWSPTGNEIAFASMREGNYDIFIRPADGSGAAEALVATPFWKGPGDWSADGRFLAYDLAHPERGYDIWYLRRKDDEQGFDEVPFLQTPFNEQNPKLSPDGRFVAYQSDESGRSEVYVTPFPEGGGKWPVSRNGGEDPRWSRDGKELFYVEGDTLVAVAVGTTPGFSAGEAERLFSEFSLQRGSYPNYDVSPDGQRFVTVESVENATPAIHVVQNWFEEFRGRKQD